MSERVIYLVRSWPRLSQTFIVNEVLALERRGLRLDIVSLVHSGETVVQPQVAYVQARVTYLDEPVSPLRAHAAAFAASPRRYLSALWLCVRRPGLATGYGDCSTMECLTHAVRVAASIEDLRRSGDEPVHVHAHFAHDPALVGMLTAMLTGLPFSFTGHARDLLQIPARSLAARAERATTLVTCCETNADYIRSTLPDGSEVPIEVIHHGVDLRRFSPTTHTPDHVPVLVSIGRLVEKKGFDDLLRALAHRPEHFTCRIYGDGPLHDELVRLRDNLGLAERVEFMGARDSDEIVAALADADAFVLTPTTTDDGDRDGIPNVLVEAMACGLPVVTTTAGGIAELVEHDVNGLLGAPEDISSIAHSIGRLLDDPQLRTRLGAAGRSKVESDFDVETAARRLEAIYSSGVRSSVSRSSNELEVAR
ncbi:glycosyltransferase family 4 protein [Aeromicrobium sp.]|uniref:glycosyltransferase family 4 protein n=1 Tax=Aeromicrobium sp. TaxID=1871063 RepID=UPI003D6B6465